MITKYLTSLNVSFSPLAASRAHRTPRLLLALLPASHKIKVSTTVLPSNSADPARITIGFKEKEIKFVESKGSEKKGGKQEAMAGTTGLGEGELDLRRLGINDVVQEVDRYSRMLARKEALDG